MSDLSSLIPQHIAIICDGNRRWARTKGWPVFKGHEFAVKNTIENLIDAASDMGVRYLTFWIFSTENWDRSKDEVEGLMNLFRYMFDQKIQQLHEKIMLSSSSATAVAWLPIFRSGLRKASI